MQLSPLDIALVVLVIAAIWAVAELALTLRKTRSTIDELATTVNDTVAEARPVIAKLDGVVDELGPASKQIDPLLAKASVAVDALSVDLADIDGVLGDVKAVTGTAANVSNAANGVVNGAAGAAQSLINRISGKPGVHAKAIAEGESVPPEDSEHVASTEAAEAVEPAQDQATADEGYFKYPEGGAQSDQASSVSNSTE